MQTNAALARSDRVFIAAMAVVLATASAALGSALSPRASIAPRVATQVASAVEGDPVRLELIAQHRCLAQALYFEARGEGRTGEEAVAEVVYHRLNSGKFGHSICGVVYEGSDHSGCQFSFTCNGDLDRRRDNSAWAKSRELAAQIITHKIALPNTTAGATHYHAVWMTPYWAPTLKRTVQVGNHIFYRAASNHHPKV